MSNYEDNVKQRIAEFLQKVAQGRENATPRAVLRTHMRDCGYPMSDRTMRRFYSTMPFVGYAIDGTRRGLFWIGTKAEALECERLRKSQGKACLAHGSETAKAVFGSGQLELPI
jgi:hypothetical protein